jgi:hypothetical protein
MARYSDPRIEADPDVIAAKRALDDLSADASYDDVLNASDNLQAVRRQVWERLGRPFIIDTDNGQYVIFQVAEGRRHPDGDIKAGEWQYQPADWSGDVFSPGYATQDEAEAAALAYVASEINEQD